MKKLIKGIVEFRQKTQAGYREQLRLLATQRPDALFVACSDSRVVPNTFASTNPGDLFVVRNVGNIVPPCGEAGRSASDESEVAAIEFSLMHLDVKDIIVCGHSECGAIKALMEGRLNLPSENLRSWLRHADCALSDRRKLNFEPHLSRANQLSQLNVLCQIDNIRTYPVVQKLMADGKLNLHGWWFDINNAEVYSYNPDKNAFVLLED
jgi:carbonic anhydrase